MSNHKKADWLFYVRSYSLILIVLGLIGYTYNPEKAVTALIMATGLGSLLYISTACLQSRIRLRSERARRIYMSVLSVYVGLIAWRMTLGWMAYMGGNTGKLFVASLLSLISLFGVVTIVGMALSKSDTNPHL